MFYSYTNLIHKYTAGFYNKISPRCSVLKPQLHIAYHSMVKKTPWWHVAQELRQHLWQSSWVHVSGVCREGELTLRQQTHLYWRHLRCILLQLTIRIDIILRSPLLWVVALHYSFRGKDVVLSSNVEKSKTDGNLISTVTKSPRLFWYSMI
jgi:hypothetical protein